MSSIPTAPSPRSPGNTAPPSLAIDLVTAPGANALSKLYPIFGMGDFIEAVSVGPFNAAARRPRGEVLAQVTVFDGQGNGVFVIHQEYVGVEGGAQTSYPGLSIKEGYQVFLTAWQLVDGVAEPLQARIVFGMGPAPLAGAVVRETPTNVGGKLGVRFQGPAAGADISFTVGTFERMNVLECVFTLLASAAVANRVPSIQETFPGGQPGYSTKPAAAITAGQTRALKGVPGYAIDEAAAFDALNTMRLPLPSPMKLDNGSVLKTSTTGIQAGDQWSGPIWVEEWAVSN